MATRPDVRSASRANEQRHGLDSAARAHEPQMRRAPIAVLG
jgi:hypothetical protein